MAHRAEVDFFNTVIGAIETMIGGIDGPEVDQIERRIRCGEPKSLVGASGLAV